MNWQPIETAPKVGGDLPQYGPLLLLFYPPQDERAPGRDGDAARYGGAIEGQWFQKFPERADDLYDGWETCIGFIGEPTYWMPHPGDPVPQGSRPDDPGVTEA